MDGRAIAGRESAWMRQVAYIPQEVFLLDTTIKRNIALGLEEAHIDGARLARAIDGAQLRPLIDELPKGVNTIVGERGVRLSGGQRQRLALARALFHDREVVVMDEATAALDQETERLVVDSIRTLHGQKSIIVIAHRLSTLRYCDLIFKLDSGRLVASGTAEVVGD